MGYCTIDKNSVRALFSTVTRYFIISLQPQDRSKLDPRSVQQDNAYSGKSADVKIYLLIKA